MNDENIEKEELALNQTDVTEKPCYALPLSPQNLVAIYKEKGEDPDNKFILWVDYPNSRLKLSPKHIMIYLANTNFRTTFSVIDDELLVEYIKSDFLVDSPLLARIVSNIIKIKFQHDISPLERELFLTFSEQQCIDFIAEHAELLDEVIESMQSIIPFSLAKLWENITPDNRLKEIELEETLSLIETVDVPSNVGPNVPMIVNSCWDVFLLVTHKLGLSLKYNIQTFNDAPKYFGKDLFYILNRSNVVNSIIDLLPPGYFQTLDDFDLEE
jgi:hypothetical protein|tara:strand:- start:311 stop:1123 length:813 start_codon:yes stop_codon:yes gene_type:complete